MLQEADKAYVRADQYLHKLLDNTQFASFPAWSPTGYLIFTRNRYVGMLLGRDHLD